MRNESEGALWQQLEGLQDPARIARFAGEASEVCNSREVDPRTAEKLELWAWRMARERSATEPDLARTVARDHLVPRCLTAEPGTDLPYRLRSFLAEWVDSLPSPAREGLRADAIARIVRALHDRTTLRNAAWTAEVIGYRHPGLARHLWQLATDDRGEDGDIALSVLAALGWQYRHRREFEAELLARVAEGPRRYVVVAMGRMPFLAGYLDLWNEWMTGPDASAARGRLESGWWLPSWLARRSPRDPAVQNACAESIFRSIRNLPDASAALDSRLAGVDSELAPKALWHLLGRLGDPDKHLDRWRCYNRITELALPAQVRSMPECLSGEATAVLRADVAISPNEAVTEREFWHERQKKALDLLLRGEQADALTWATQALQDHPYAVALAAQPHNRPQTDETGGRAFEWQLTQIDLLQMLACFRIDPLPEQVRGWITEDFDENRAEGGPWRYEGAPRRGALTLAGSAGTLRALVDLLHFGIRMGATMPVEVCDGLADCAEVLFSEDNPDSTLGWAILLDHLHGQGPETAQDVDRRLPAAFALLRLSALGMLPTHVAQVLADWFRADPSEDLCKAYVATALGFGADEAVVGAIAALRGHASGGADDSQLTWRATSALARLGVLGNDEQLISTRLRLGRGGNPDLCQLPPASEFASPDSAAAVVGLLYERPDTRKRFGPLAREIIEHWPYESLGALYGSLLRVGRECWPVVGEVVIARCRQKQRSSLAENEWFWLIGQLAAHELARCDWRDVWHDWMPDGRVAFADALRAAKGSGKETEGAAFALLSELAGDGTYAVRRSAYRAMAALHPEGLELWVQQRQSQRGPVVERERAAEALWWASPKIASRSLGDSEPTVRDAAARCREEARLRWAARSHLEAVARSLATTKDTNAAMLTAWRFGEALVQTGDDDKLRSLQELREQALPHQRHWLERLHKALLDSWRRRTQKWPEPWVALQGRIEHTDGWLVSPAGDETPVRVQLSQAMPKGEGEWRRWEGIVSVADEDEWLTLRYDRLRLVDTAEPFGIILRYVANGQWGYFASSGPLPPRRGE